MKIKCDNCVFVVCLAFVIATGSVGGRLKPRIIGGEDADIRQFPYQASIRIRDKVICGAVIISDKHVLTAAHCTTSHSRFVPPYDSVRINTGTRSSAETGHAYRIERVTAHPGWQLAPEMNNFANDIAVITLASTMRFDESQQKIERASYDVVSDAKATLTGWGYTSTTNKAASVLLQKLDVWLLSGADCQQFMDITIHHHFQMCGYHSLGHGACLGDSGGPVVVDNQLVAIVSLVTEEDCAIGVPDVFTNVYTHREFIETAMRQ